MNTAHRGVVAGWALAGGELLAGAGLLKVAGEGPVYRGTRARPFLGGIMIAIGLGWDVFGAAVTFDGW